MSQIVEQVLTVTPAGTETPTITLDGDSADLLAGGNGIDGDLRLSDAAGQERVRLSAADNSLALRDASGALMAELSGAGDLTLGGAAGDGDLLLRDTTGVLRISLEASSHRLRLRNAEGLSICTLGPNCDFTLGGSGSDGDISLKDGSGQVRIELDADNQRLRLRAADGSVVADLGPNGNLVLGGGAGSDGDISLKDAAGNVRLALDAENHLLRIRNASGLEVGRLGDHANLRLGGNGSDGDVVLSDANGTTRIELDAAGQGLSLYDAQGNQIGSLGPNSNLRLGGHGSDGDILLYPEGANDIFSTADASIHLDANAGDITLRNADCAEEFEVMPRVCAEPGTVMALGEDGRLRPSCRTHETAVVGVVSGAGAYRPGIVLDKQPGQAHRSPIALMGKAYVKVTDEGGPIRIGDLLTSSGTEGHAMRATDPMRAFGAVIGKAIAAHASGAGLIPMIIALQ